MTGRTVPIAAAAVLAGSTTLAFVFVARRALLRPEAEGVPGYPDVVARAPARGMWAYFPHLAFVVFLVLIFASPAGVEPKILGLLGSAGAYVLAGTWLGAEAAPWAYGAGRLDSERERAVVAALGGGVRRVWVTPYPMVAGPIGTVATIAGRSLFIWGPIGRLRPDEIAGGIAFRAARRRAWPAGIIAVWAARLIEEGNNLTVARWTLYALLGASLAAGVVFEGRWLRARRRFGADGLRARAAITGVLAIGREQARLAATGSLPSAPGMRRASIADLLWRRALAQSGRIATTAGLDPSTVSDGAREIAGREAGSARLDAPPPLPEIPEGGRLETARRRGPGRRGRRLRP